MCGPWKRINRRAHGQQCRGNQAPLAPAAFDAALGKGDGGIARQGCANTLKIGSFGATIEMNRNKITSRGQPFRLRNNPFGIFMTQKNIGDFCH